MISGAPQWAQRRRIALPGVADRTGRTSTPQRE
jgi:hypothetical protein